MSNAVSLGEPEAPGTDPYRDYFSRAYDARHTWAIHARYFYLVTGHSSSETRVFSNESNCKNQTSSYIDLFPHFNKQVYKCKGIKVLHIPTCDGTSWGPHGPCCRCQHAMEYFIDMYNIHKNYADWFIFSDDDYYMRLEYLSEVLNNPLTPSTGHYAITAWGNGDSWIPADDTSVNSNNSNSREFLHREITANGFALKLWSPNCTVPCIHRFPWMGWGGFSIGFLKNVEPSIRKNSLIKVCESYMKTHDIGLGIYTWMQAPDLIRVLGDSYTWDQVIWHKPPLKYDEMFEETWIRAISSSIEVSSYGIQSRHADKRFNMNEFIEFEKSSAKILKNKLPPIQLFGIKNSYLYHTKSMIQNNLFNNSDNDNIGLDVSDYSLRDCNDDYSKFVKWAEQNHWRCIYNEQQYEIPLEPTNNYYERFTQNEDDNSHNELKMCEDYNKYILSYK